MTIHADAAASTSSNRARDWIPVGSQERESAIRDAIAVLAGNDTAALVESLIERNRQIHDVECINLNPATNVMNPRAEAALSAGLGSRPSLGYAGAKYEMGLEAIEEIEVIAADLACRVFDARFAEIRVGSGALANLYAFMATCQPGDSIIVPPATIGGHITHRPGGAAGLYGLDIHECPIDAQRFTDGPVARIRTPQRVPYGFHSHWVARDQHLGQACRAWRTPFWRRASASRAATMRAVFGPAMPML